LWSLSFLSALRQIFTRLALNLQSSEFSICANRSSWKRLQPLPSGADGDVLNPLVNINAALAVAIVAEVIGTTFLHLSQQFSKPLPTAIMGLCYIASFYYLSLALKTIPIGVAYAIWSGLGLLLICAIAYVQFRQALDLPAMIGVGLIILSASSSRTSFRSW
jgi:small multidrug resistance pump